MYSLKGIWIWDSEDGYIYSRIYDMTIKYHSRKANVVADDLSRKAASMGNLVYMMRMVHLWWKEWFVFLEFMAWFKNYWRSPIVQDILYGVTKMYRDLKQIYW